MYDDYYYYEEQRKAQTKSDAALAGTFATGICGGIGIVFSVIMFLINRFDILSSALMALAGYILTYKQEWNNCSVYHWRYYYIWYINDTAAYIFGRKDNIHGFCMCNCSAAWWMLENI